MTPEKHLIIDYRSAQSLIVKRIRPSGRVENLELPYCVGRVSAEEVKAPMDLPPFDVSLVDGYAVRAEETAAASSSSPVFLKIVEETRRGRAPRKSVRAGECVRVWNGAPIPKGGNAVVPMENTSFPRSEGKPDSGRIQMTRRISPGDHLLLEGSDMKKGDLTVKAGSSMSPRMLGLAAGLGLARLKVNSMPAVGVLALGEERMEPGLKLSPGKVYNASASLLVSELLAMGLEPVYLGIARSQAKSVKKRIKAALAKLDVLVVTGCPDLHKSIELQGVLESSGELVIRGARVKPGDGFLFGVVRKKPVFVLPRDASGALVDFELFVRPALLQWMGHAEVFRMRVGALLQESVADFRGMAKFIRAFTWTENRALYTIPSGHQGPAYLHSLARANSLIVLEEEMDKREIGDEVDVLLL